MRLPEDFSKDFSRMVFFLCSSMAEVLFRRCFRVVRKEKLEVGVIFRAGSIYLFTKSRERCQFREVKRKKYLCGSWKSICFSNEFLLSEIDLVVNIYC